MKSPALHLAGVLAAILLIGGLDYATGDELDLFIFYFIPIGLAAWFLGLRTSLAAAGLAAGMWFAANSVATRPYSHAAFGYWAGLIMLTAFACAALGMARIRALLERQAELNRELAGAMAKIKKLSGRLPICVGCKDVQDAHGTWLQIEAYFTAQSEEDFVFKQMVCPRCRERQERRTGGRGGLQVTPEPPLAPAGSTT